MWEKGWGGRSERMERMLLDIERFKKEVLEDGGIEIGK